MKLVKLSTIFNIEYGNSFELNRLAQEQQGINFISRTARNNGVSAIVSLVEGIKPFAKGAITVSLGGSVLEAFVQPLPFYTGYHIYCLTPKKPMSDAIKLYYCSCIRANKYRYNYGRQANRTLKDLLIPSLESIPKEIASTDLSVYQNLNQPASKGEVKLDINSWQEFIYSDLFEIERGKGPRKKDLNGEGSTPFVTSTDQNNGWTDFTNVKPMHEANVIGVNRNGSVAYAFYQPIPFCSTEDVHIFKPKFTLNKYIALFLVTLIRKEKYRYNYGRKWGIGRMNISTIKLPTNSDGQPDWIYMENYIKSLKYSMQI